jgi:Nif-specific regulatory protein
VLLPPLRERSSDIPLLAARFLEQFNEENGRELAFTKEAMQVLKSCYFPGNVRELDNCVQRTATFADGEAIVASDFACGRDQCLSATLWKGKSTTSNGWDKAISAPTPAELPAEAPREEKQLERPAAPVARAPVPAPVVPDEDGIDSVKVPKAEAYEAGRGAGQSSERERLLEVMEKSGWVQAKAARMLGLTPRQIGYALRKHDIEIKKF